MYSALKKILFIILLVFCCNINIVAEDIITIVYKQSEYNIDSLYINNGEELAKLKAASMLDIDSIVIVGSASPEGKLSFNNFLAIHRAKSIKDYLLQDSVKDINIILKSLGEDWETWEFYIREFYDGKYRDQVISILDTEPDLEKRKSLLKRINNYKVYQELVQKYGEYCRISTTRIYFNERQFILPEPVFNIPDVFIHPDSILSGYVIPEYPEIINPDKEFIFAIKTNIAYDLLWFINYAVEFKLSDHFSVSAQHIFSDWIPKKNDYCNQSVLVGCDVKYWLKPFDDRWFNKSAFGLYAFSGYSDLQWDREICYQASGYSVGLSYTYSLKLYDKLRLELLLGAGYTHINYQHYNPSVDYSLLFRDRSDFGILNYVGPSKIEVSLSIPIKINF